MTGRFQVFNSVEIVVGISHLKDFCGVIDVVGTSAHVEFERLMNLVREEIRYTAQVAQYLEHSGTVLVNELKYHEILNPKI